MASRINPFPQAFERLTGCSEEFQASLLSWFSANARLLPWRQTKDPYHIWISEIILQQTRVDQAIPYYTRFLAAFPTVEHLATTPLDDVLKQWEGLGYYTRARNLHRAAKLVVDQFGGVVPSDYSALLTLPGVGPYTAAAIASIAFGKPHGVVDGNVVRVLSRLTAFESDVTTASSKKLLQCLIDELLFSADPGTFNEAMMELGAMVCRPKQPDCPICPVRRLCQSADGKPESYPRKAPKKTIPHFDIAVAILSNDRGEFYIQRRPENGLLGGLWEFPGGKRESEESIEETCRREVREELGLDVVVGERVATIKHAYSHFKITLHAFRCTIVSQVDDAYGLTQHQWIASDSLQEYAFPRANRKLINILIASESKVIQPGNH